jgi:6-phosphogluconate dehydrogenase
MKNEIVIIGLGKMGANMSLRLTQRGWKVLGLDKGDDFSLIKGLLRPRIIFLSVPAQAVDAVLKVIQPFLEEGDIIVDSGNTYFKDSIKHAREMNKKGMRFIDVGISGGPEGAKRGAALMIGGDKKTFEYLLPLFKDLAREDAYQFFEGAGAGHFVKMVHNGIEYGMMQALAEGFTILKKSKFNLDLEKVADIYNHGSVIESRLVSWVQDSLKEYGQDFKNISGKVGHTGEGAWTVKTAKEMGIDAKVLDEAFRFRIKSQKKPSWTGKFLTALRAQFGGHSTK